MAIHLLIIGTNYKGTSFALPDCELDCLNIGEVLGPYCQTITRAIGKRATRGNVFDSIIAFRRGLSAGDLGIAYFSGHGTEDKVKGRKVQAIVCHDGKLIYDFELHREFAQRDSGSLLVSMGDCCYSGGLLRGLRHGSPRTIPVNSTIRPSKVKLLGKGPDLVDARFTACSANEVAFSTGHGGAWTNAAIEVFNELRSNATLPAVHKGICKLLPSDDWDQTPQSRIDKALKRRTLKSFLAA